MPGQQGLRRHDRGHLRQKPATEPFRLGRQTTPLVVVEPKPPATKLFFEDPILFTKMGRRLRQTTPLVVVEPKPPATKLFFEDPILFTKMGRRPPREVTS